MSLLDKISVALLIWGAFFFMVFPALADYNSKWAPFFARAGFACLISATLITVFS